MSTSFSELSKLISSDEFVLPQMFPWIRDLSAAEVREFVADLVDAIGDAAELEVHANLHY